MKLNRKKNVNKTIKLTSLMKPGSRSTTDKIQLQARFNHAVTVAVI